MGGSEQRGDQYAAIAAVFDEIDRLPLRAMAEVPTFLAGLGPVKALDVLDLACGTGFYSRLLHELGARSVTSVDISEAMLNVARSRSAPTDPVRYLCHNVAEPMDLGLFDVITASFLLNYAATRDELGAMCANTGRHLRPGGRFVGNLTNSDFDSDHPHDDRYGLTISWTHPTDGDELAFELRSTTTIRASCYYWTNDTYRAALHEAGLDGIEFHPWMPDQAGIDTLGAEFWRPWTANPTLMVVTAHRAKS
jgi:SAM-dependent methyltransferase